MSRTVIIIVIALLGFILWMILKLLASGKQQGAANARSTAPSPAASVPDALLDPEDGEQVPVVEYDGEFSTVSEDGVIAISTEDEYEPWYDMDDENEPEQAPIQQDGIDRDFWAEWDRAASSEDSEQKIRQYSQFLADSGYITKEQADEVAKKSIAYSKDAVKRETLKDATRVHSGIFCEEYSFPPEPERVYIEY